MSGLNISSTLPIPALSPDLERRLLNFLPSQVAAAVHQCLVRSWSAVDSAKNAGLQVLSITDYSPSGTPPAGCVRLIRPVAGRPRDREPIAKMFVSGRGGSIRRLIGSAHRHVIAMRRDPQMRFGQPNEGIAEGPAMMRCATDPDITYYQFQPFRIELPVGGKLASWICDVFYVMRDGSVHVREIKRSSADLAKPGYEAKLHAVKGMLSGLGWQFSPWTLPEIRGSEERQVNVANIYFDRAAHIDDLMRRFEEVAAEVVETTYGDLIRMLDPRNTCRARAAVHRLIMKGRVWADLDRLLEDWSDVRLRGPALIPLDLPFA